MGLLKDLCKGAKAAGEVFVKEAQLKEKSAATQNNIAVGLRKLADKVESKLNEIDTAKV